mmetsp:Transcript_78903/g.231591  ORF Transcript_78903/g.231591 Transcript_78903/m.231591 type:complete len:384 (-) Transcript_78903:322-1473(-)
MLSCQQVGNIGEPVAAGSVAKWILANDGTVAWPEGTTLRLVGGPVLASPVLDVPCAEPGQALEVDLEVAPEAGGSEAFYSLVTPCGQPFGEILKLSVSVVNPETEAPTPTPVPACAVVASPVDSCEEGLDSLQGELKAVEWTLANVGLVPWPKDACCRLIYNTPGFDHLPPEICIPEDVAPGLTLQVGITALMPEMAGQFKAMWALSSPSSSEFGEVLFVEFNVGDFPFMEWMLADAASAESVSDAVSEAPQAEENASESLKLSAAHVLHKHMTTGGQVSYDEAETEGFVSLGCMTGVAPRDFWVIELAMANDGNVAWPESTSLTCCFGDNLGCGAQLLGAVQPGEAAVLQMSFTAPEVPGRSAWVLADGNACFGPVFMMEVL